MTYRLKRIARGMLHNAPMSEQEFLELRRVRNVISSHLGIERRLDIVFNNYIDLETVIHNLTVEHTVRFMSFFDSTNESFSSIDRTLINFLASARGYRDQAGRYSPQGQTGTIKEFFTEKTKESVAFRALDALRNYSQHFSLPIDGMSLPGHWVKHKRQQGLVPYLRISKFAKGLRSSETLLNELALIASEPDEVLILPLVRKYVEDISYVHESVRNLLRPEEQDAKSFITKIRENAGQKPSADDDHITAYHFHNDGSVAEEIYLGKEMLETLDSLRNKNRVPIVGFGSVEFLT